MTDIYELPEELDSDLDPIVTGLENPLLDLEEPTYFLENGLEVIDTDKRAEFGKTLENPLENDPDLPGETEDWDVMDQMEEDDYDDLEWEYSEEEQAAFEAEENALREIVEAQETKTGEEMLELVMKPATLANVGLSNDFSGDLRKHWEDAKKVADGVDMIEVLPEPTAEEMEAWMASLVPATAAIPAVPKAVEMDEDRVPRKKIEGRLISDEGILEIYHNRYTNKMSYQKCGNALLDKYGVKVSIDLIRSIVLGEIYKDLVDSSPYATEIKEARARSGIHSAGV